MAKASTKKAVSKSKKLLKKPVKRAKTTVRKKKVLAIPKGYNSVTPYLIMDHKAAEAIKFYKKVFAAKEALRMEHKGKIVHAELKIGDVRIMLADECPEMGCLSPKAYGGSPVGMHLYIKGVDAVVRKAVSNGAKLMRKVEDMFWGDRSGTVLDPYGHKWTISTHVEDVTPAKLRKRAAEVFAKQQNSV